MLRVHVWGACLGPMFGGHARGPCLGAMLGGYVWGVCFRGLRGACSGAVIWGHALGISGGNARGLCSRDLRRAYVSGAPIFFDCCTVVVLKVHVLAGNFGGARCILGLAQCGPAQRGYGYGSKYIVKRGYGSKFPYLFFDVTIRIDNIMRSS